MTLHWSERMIGRALCTQLLGRKCIVLVPNTTWTGYECDVLAVTMDLRVIDIEIKISRSDLKADAKKDKWWQRSDSWRPWAGETRPEPIAREWPRKVWKHYYALPAEIWKPELLDCLPSPKSGVLLLSHGRSPTMPAVVVRCERRSTPNKEAQKLKPEQALDVARLANLRMWESYAEIHKITNAPPQMEAA